jgi:hypothetical protein
VKGSKIHNQMLRAAGIILMAFLLGKGTAKADHFSGASITYECLGGGIYMFNLDLYLDCSGFNITPQTLNFSSTCGTTITASNLSPSEVEEVSPLCPSQIANSTCNGGWLPSYRRYRFRVPVFLAPCNGTWKADWYICCRNTLVNVVNEPGTYADATLNNWLVACDNSPEFPTTTIPYVCVNEPFSYNPGATDVDGNPFTYELINARFGSPTPFSVTYEVGYSGAQPIQGLTFDPASGQISGTPTQVGNYVVVFKVISYDAFGNVIGTVIRDLMFIVYICDEAPPVTTGISNITAGIVVGPNSAGPCDGVSFCFDVVFTDDNPDSEITIISDAQTLLPGSTLTITGTNPAVATFCWTTNTSLLPVNIFMYATDGACPIENVASRAIYLNDCLILPIELVHFSADVEGHVVRTRWTTASERNNDYFTVERSQDGHHFELLGTVKAVGNSQSPVDYEFLDLSPWAGTTYYRLLQTDVDGSKSFSNMVPVTIRPVDHIMATAETASGWRVTRLPEEGEWVLVDMLGRTMQQGSLDDSGTLRLQIHATPDAMHLLMVRGVGSEQQVLKLPALGSAPPGMTVSSGS